MTCVQAGAFDHKRHAPLKLPCTYCHAGAVKAERAGMPDDARCKTCHTDGRPAPRFHAHLADFVFFSHGGHAAAHITCETCHGKEAQQSPTAMKACIECHKANRAPVACTTCHELSQ